MAMTMRLFVRNCHTTLNIDTYKKLQEKGKQNRNTSGSFRPTCFSTSKLQNSKNPIVFCNVNSITAEQRNIISLGTVQTHEHQFRMRPGAAPRNGITAKQRTSECLCLWKEKKTTICGTPLEIGPVKLFGFKNKQRMKKRLTKINVSLIQFSPRSRKQINQLGAIPQNRRKAKIKPQRFLNWCTEENMGLQQF